jgi:hypothetical protein
LVGVNDSRTLSGEVDGVIDLLRRAVVSRPRDGQVWCTSRADMVSTHEIRSAPRQLPASLVRWGDFDLVRGEQSSIVLLVLPSPAIIV